MASGNALIFRRGTLRNRWVAEISIGPGRAARYQYAWCRVLGVRGKRRAYSHWLLD